MLSLDDFLPVELGDRPMILGHYAKFPPVHSDYAFGTMMAWQHYIAYKYAWLGDSLVLLTEGLGWRQVRPPIGPRDPGAAREVMRFALEIGTDPPLGMIDPPTKAWLSGEFPALAFLPHRNYFDYFYQARELADLPGKGYLNIRNKLNKFRRRYDSSVEPIAPGNLGEVMALLRRWCLWRDCESEFMLQFERGAVLYAVEHMAQLGLDGLALRVEGELQAMAVYEPLNAETAVVHFEKAIPDLEGTYQAVNRETAIVLAPRFEFVNRECDMGEPGLRRAKERYHPHHMVEVWHVERPTLERALR